MDLLPVPRQAGRSESTVFNQPQSEFPVEPLRSDGSWCIVCPGDSKENICASQARAHSSDACVRKQKLSSCREASGCGVGEGGVRVQTIDS